MLVQRQPMFELAVESFREDGADQILIGLTVNCSRM